MNRAENRSASVRALAVRGAVVLALALGLAIGTPASAKAEVVDCGGAQEFGFLTCTTTGPAMINGTSFAGDGGSSAQLQWRGSLSATAPGTLELSYTYTQVFNILFAKIGMRLTVSQPGCHDAQDSERRWVDPSAEDGAPQRLVVAVPCSGPVNYTITSRAATYSLGGSYLGQLSLTGLTLTPAVS